MTVLTLIIPLCYNKHNEAGTTYEDKRMKTITETKQHAQLLTVPEAAQRLGISPRKTWQLISEGQLQVVHVGLRSTRILESVLDAFIERLKVAAIHCN